MKYQLIMIKDVVGLLAKELLQFNLKNTLKFIIHSQLCLKKDVSHVEERIKKFNIMMIVMCAIHARKIYRHLMDKMLDFK